MNSAEMWPIIAICKKTWEDYYYSGIETDDLALPNQEWQVTTLIVNRQWDEAEKAAGDEGKPDLSYGCNRQYVENEEIKREMEEEKAQLLN